MKPYRIFEGVTHAELKKILAWLKRYMKFGVYCDAIQVGDLWDVRVYCAPIYTDKLGNSALKR